MTPVTAQLHSVIANGSVSELSDLLQSGVAVNAPGQRGITALMVAIEAKSLEKISLLLGYRDERKFNTTPVYRLNTRNFEMQRVETMGDSPGWIHGHLASLDVASHSIRIHGGQVQKDGSTMVDNTATFVLHLDDHRWSRVVESNSH